MEPLIERFTGKYDAVAGEHQPELLAEGSIAAGKNVRKISSYGGWKPRKGYSLLNTTAVGSKIQNVFGFKNELGGDYHLITQVGGELRDSTAAAEDLITLAGEVLTTLSGEILQARTSLEAFEQGTTLGTSLFSGCSAETKGTADVVGKKWIYADGSGMPVVYSGNAAYPKAFFLLTAGGELIEYSSEVKDKSDATYAGIPITSTVYYVVTHERCSGLYLYFGTNKNTNNVSVTVAAMRSGSYTGVSGQSDGTAGTYTHDTDGAISWTASTSDDLAFLGGTHGYVYRVTFSGAPTAIDITRVRVIAAAQRMTLKWDEVYRYPTAIRFFDESVGHYIDRLGAGTSVSEDEYIDISSATTSDFLYIGVPELACVFGFAIADGYTNTDAALIDAVEVYASGGWTSVGFVDTTLDVANDSSFGQTGRVYLNKHTGVRTLIPDTGEQVPKFWYRFSWAVALSADVRIFTVVYGAQPADYPRLNGIVEFQGRAVYWGHPDYPNRLILSPYGRPDQLCALTAGENLSFPFGDGGEIRACGILPNALVVVKDKGIFYTEDGITPVVVDPRVGTINAATFCVASYGDQTMNKEQIQSVAMWQDTDGTYKFDRTGLSKVSGPVDSFFNLMYSSALSGEDYDWLCATVDQNNNEYHLVLPTEELVYSLPGDEWYPSWERELPLSAIASVKDQDDRFRLVGGTEDGFLLLMEETDNDRDSSNTEVAIEHSIKTRTFVAAPPVLEQAVRTVWAQFKAQSSGTVTLKIYASHATTGTEEAVPAALSLVASGKDFTVDYLDLSSMQVLSVAFELICNALDTEMWVNWLAAMLEPTGLKIGE